MSDARAHDGGNADETLLARVRARVASAPWAHLARIALGVLAALVLLIGAFLALVDWNTMRGPLGQLASRMSGRTVTITGALDVDPWSLAPRARAEGVTIGPTRVYGGGEALARIGSLDVRVRLLPLILGRLEIEALELQSADIRARRRADGVTNWSNGGPERPLRLPLIRRLSVIGSHLDFVDARRDLRLDAAFATEERAGAEGGGRFALQGAGALNGKALSLTLSGGPLVNVRRDRPYPFELAVGMGATRVRAEGTIARPFDLTRLTARVQANGPDLADLYHLTGAALPNSPPYRLSAHLERDGPRLSLTQIRGRVGDSDVSGALTAIKPAGGRLRVTGTMLSRALDFDDLLAVLGGAPDTNETASATQRAVAEELARTARLLPDARLDIARVRNMDADVTFRALSVRAGRLPIRAMEARVTLDRGLLRIDPARIALSPGSLAGAAEIDARADGAPRVRIDVRLSGARMEAFMGAKPNAAPAIVGPMRGRAQLAGRGFSVRTAAASADGRMTFYAPDGAVREAFAELTGINVARGLGLLVTGDQSKVDLRCAVADFAVKDGTARSAVLVADTGTMLISGGGGFSLRDETLDLRLQGKPKEPRLIRVAAPIRVRGAVRAPKIGLETGKAVQQGGFAAVLATALAPLAAVLPFVDAGTADDADCGALLARVRAPATPRAEKRGSAER